MRMPVQCGPYSAGTPKWGTGVAGIGVQPRLNRAAIVNEEWRGLRNMVRAKAKVKSQAKIQDGTRKDNVSVVLDRTGSEQASERPGGPGPANNKIFIVYRRSERRSIYSTVLDPTRCMGMLLCSAALCMPVCLCPLSIPMHVLTARNESLCLVMQLVIVGTVVS
jgi:hypothetical protein